MIDWVICCGMPRSGSTLQYQVVTHLVEARGIGQGIGFFDRAHFEVAESEYIPGQIKVVKCHEYIPRALELAEEGRAVGVYSQRDMRDVVVSVMNQSNKSFSEVASRSRLRNLVEQSHSWKKMSPLLVSRYENLYRKLDVEIRRIAEFLKLRVSESEIEELVTTYSISTQKKRILEISSQNLSPSGFGGYDPKSQLHQGHIQSAKLDRWKTELSKMQAAYIECYLGQWLLSEQYEISQNVLMRFLARFIYR